MTPEKKEFVHNSQSAGTTVGFKVKTAQSPNGLSLQQIEEAAACKKIANAVSEFLTIDELSQFVNMNAEAMDAWLERALCEEFPTDDICNGIFLMNRVTTFLTQLSNLSERLDHIKSQKKI